MVGLALRLEGVGGGGQAGGGGEGSLVRRMGETGRCIVRFVWFGFVGGGDENAGGRQLG